MEELSILELQAKMERGELTARQLVQQYLQRIQQIDQHGPALHAVIEINPEALQIAERLDQERRAKGPRSPLHGIPILLKDNIDTGDRMTTTAGSLALEGHYAAADAAVARRLRRLGAIFLGKANLSEWANFRSTRSVSGWSSRGGQTRNPYVLDRSPCGSSSGSAVAVAANLCAAAVGTETDGSIVCPAHTNGIVGLKPTIGLVSRSGIIPISHNQDTAGPLTRCVADAAILLSAMAGFDRQDPAMTSTRRRKPIDYTQFLDPHGLKGARLGVARNYFGFHPAVDQIMEDCLELLRQCGAELIDPANLENEEQFSASELEVLYYDFKADLNAYLARLPATAAVHSLEDLIRFNQDHAERVMPFFGQERFLKAQEKGPLTEPAYQEALAQNLRLSRTEGIDALLQKHHLDAIIAPTGGPAWLIDRLNGDHYGGGCSSPAAVAGYPHITVPAGFVAGLPIGLSFFAGAFQEGRLIQLAYAFEQASRARRPPQYLPTLADWMIPPLTKREASPSATV